jgi:hypothetical protein
MALLTFNEIKEQVTENLEEILSSKDPEAFLNELADGFVPIYDSDIISEWVELPAEDSDQWKELGYDTQRNEGGIVSLMQIDLVVYYINGFTKAWEEINNGD